MSLAMVRPGATAAGTATGIWVQQLGLDSPGDAVMVMDTHGRLRLIDAARHRTEVASRLRDAGVRRLHSIVCTRCDDDHVGGIAAVLRDVTVDELWVPATWGDLVIGAALGPDEWREQLLSAQPGDRAHDTNDPLRNRADHSDVSSTGYGAHYLPAAARRDDERAVLARGVTLLSDTRRMHERLRRAVMLVTDIIGAAVDRGTRVRCFSHEAAAIDVDPHLWQTSGDRRCLTFVNAREVAIGSAPPVPLESALRLALQPGRSLVPIVHGAAQGSDALICSDSTFDFLGRNRIPWDNIGLVVATHHGAGDETTTRLYRDAAEHEFTGYWIRAHDEHHTWPGNAWMRLDRGRRFCTRCRGAAAGARAQDLSFSLGLGWEHPWQAHPIGLARPCRCS